MVKLFDRLFGSSGESPKPKVVARQTYNEFEIRAAPIKEANGWRIAGSVAKVIDGVEERHDFIRADICADEETAADLTISKGRRLVDEQGEKVFKKN